MIDISSKGKCLWSISNFIGWRSGCGFNIRETHYGLNIANMNGEEILKNVVICPKCGKEIELYKKSVLNQVMCYVPRTLL